LSRERPCRTLFIRNINVCFRSKPFESKEKTREEREAHAYRNRQYGVTGDEIREQFERMGDIKSFFDLISQRGMVFITYVRDKMISASFKFRRTHRLSCVSIDFPFIEKIVSSMTSEVL
jgi:RNA recognition motif-containing protein